MKKILMIIMILFVTNLYSLTTYKFGDSMLNEKYHLTTTNLIYGFMVEANYDTGSDCDYYAEEFILGSVSYRTVRFEDRLKFVNTVRKYFVEKYKEPVKVPMYLNISSLLYDIYFKRFIINNSGIKYNDSLKVFDNEMKKKIEAFILIDSIYFFKTDPDYYVEIIVIPYEKIGIRMNNFKKWMQMSNDNNKITDK